MHLCALASFRLKGPLLYTLSPERIARFPGHVRGVILARDAINIKGPIDQAARMLLKAQIWKTMLRRRWTGRQAELTRLTRQTDWVAIDVDGLPPVTRADVETICGEPATWTRRFCGAQAEIKRLAEDSLAIEI